MYKLYIGYIGYTKKLFLHGENKKKYEKILVINYSHRFLKANHKIFIILIFLLLKPIG